MQQVPNSNDFGDPTKILHHTTADESFQQELRCFQEVTCCQVLSTAHFADVCTAVNVHNGQWTALLDKQISLLQC